MDQEAELIKKQSWHELRRFYSSKTGHAWELAWVSLAHFQDRAKAIDQFLVSLQDPRYEEASYIMLWKLGRRPSPAALRGPKSLLLYDAFLQGRTATLVHYVTESKKNSVYAPFLLDRHLETLSARDLIELEGVQVSSELALNFSEIWQAKHKDFQRAKKYLLIFLHDPWSMKILEDLKVVFDSDLLKRLQGAYARREVHEIESLLGVAKARAKRGPSILWIQAFQAAIDEDIRSAGRHITSFEFWKLSPLSPRAIQSMREQLYSKEEVPAPDFVNFWEKFFSSQDLIQIPRDLDTDSRGLWQIRVEMDRGLLSEALSFFPMEERFLFLWSLRQREQEQKDPRRWPAHERENAVVRKSLERAFERSSNKVLWFDRLRTSGCSQSFYEYAIENAPIPIEWVVEDLKKGFITESPGVRGFLTKQLSTTVPGQGQDIRPELLHEGLRYLTPAEKQQVLLSRFVLSNPPSEILEDETLDLLWDAQNQVSPDTFARWVRAVLDHVHAQRTKDFSSRQWRWIEKGWELNPAECERFSPLLNAGVNFPWSTYLDRLDTHGLHDLLLTTLSFVADDRLKESWIRHFLSESMDGRLYQAMSHLKTESVRHELLALWYEKKGDVSKALEHLGAQLESTPVLNEQVSISKRILNLLMAHPHIKGGIEFLDLAYRSLVDSKALDQNSGILVSDLYASSARFDRAWSVVAYLWSHGSISEKHALLPIFLERAFQARCVEATQRILVDYVIDTPLPSKSTYEVLKVLLEADSAFRIKHLREEFVEKASQIYPVQKDLLRARAAYDYRALLLWESFYGEDLQVKASPEVVSEKRKYELWSLTESLIQVEAMTPYVKYFDLHGALPNLKPIEHAFLDKARRILQRLQKSYGTRKSVDFQIASELPTPFVVYFKSRTLLVSQDFFNELDEESWATLCVGLLQVFYDYERGLFDEKSLVQRFFQGGLLAGTPVAKNIRLWVWLSMHERLIEPQVLRASPEQIVERLPLVNSLLVFYLSHSFAVKASEAGLIPI